MPFQKYNVAELMLIYISVCLVGGFVLCSRVWPFFGRAYWRAETAILCGERSDEDEALARTSAACLLCQFGSEPLGSTKRRERETRRENSKCLKSYISTTSFSGHALVTTDEKNKKRPCTEL